MIPPALRIPWNADVAAWIERQPDLSAHGDVAEVLELAAHGLRDVRSYCPDLRAYRWVALHLKNGRVFALACGQSTLLFRLPAAAGAEAEAAGAQAQPEIGPGWWALRAWDLPRGAAAAWCKRAHDAAAAAE